MGKKNKTDKIRKKKKKKRSIVAMRSHASEFPSMNAVENMDPKFHYRWVNKAGNQVQHRKAMGYIVVQGRDAKETAVCIDGGTIREHADAILMKIPVKKAVAIHRRSVERSNRFTKTLTNKKSQREYYEEVLRKDGIEDRLIKID